MRTAQLDKNAGGKKLRDLCNAQGLVRCFLLPEGVRVAGDQEVAEFAINHQNLTLTFDRTFCFVAANVLAGRNPGLLLLRADDRSVQQISTKTAPAMLGTFKEQFPDWHLVPWRNSFVKITPTLVYVHHTRSAPPGFVAVLQRSEAGWQDVFRRLLVDNAGGLLENEGGPAGQSSGEEGGTNTG